LAERDFIKFVATATERRGSSVGQRAALFWGGGANRIQRPVKVVQAVEHKAPRHLVSL